MFPLINHNIKEDQENQEKIQENPKKDEENLTFEEYLTLSGYADNTLKTYMRYFNLLKGMGDPLTQEKIDRFCRKYRHSVARTFLKSYLKDFLKIKDLDIKKIRGRRQKRLPQYLTYDEVLLFAESTDPRTSLMIRLMFEGGLRVSELLSLKRENIDMEKKEIKGIGKGNKEFVVNFKEKTKKQLAEYMSSHAIASSDFLFPISRQRVFMIIRKDSEDLFEKKISPHALRHSCGTYLRQQGWDLIEIQKYLRHEKLETVGIYTHLAREEIKQKIEMLEDGK